MTGTLLAFLNRLMASPEPGDEPPDPDWLGRILTVLFFVFLAATVAAISKI